MQSIKSGCKINTYLKIMGKRENGYHDIESIFYPISYPYDVLNFTATNTNNISINCASKTLDVSNIDLQNNTLTKAYTAFKKFGGEIGGVHIDLEKNIPNGAGLGGGSGDAATVLKWCNDHATKKISAQNLHDAALSVGADVPFFLLNSPAHVQGIGDIINPKKKFLKGKIILIVCSQVFISSPWAYKAYDEQKNKKNVLQSLTSLPYKCKHIFSNGSCFVNDFEEVVFLKYPELLEIKEMLLQNGALAACMSGSGSSIFAIYKSLDKVQEIVHKTKSPRAMFFASIL